jgi:hypothetical protein
MRKQSEEVAQLRQLQRVSLFATTRNRRKAVGGDVARLILTLSKDQMPPKSPEIPAKPLKSVLSPSLLRLDKLDFPKETDRIRNFSHNCSQAMLRTVDNSAYLLLSERSSVDHYHQFAAEKAFKPLFSSSKSGMLELGPIAQSITNLAGVKKTYVSVSPRRKKAGISKAAGE